jgi:uncharacterized membrane-anchored protein
MRLPPDHPRRVELNEEVHARPPESLTAPERVSSLAILVEAADRGGEIRHLGELAIDAGRAPPGVEATHFSADFGTFRLRWERHTEFSRYTFVVPGMGEDPFADPAINQVPPDFLSGLPGETIAAAHVAFVPAGLDAPWLQDLSQAVFAENALVGSEISGRAAAAFTDFRIHSDGFGRFVVQDRQLKARQAGRLVQRLLEIDAYKTLALLAFPVARELGPFLRRAEQELAAVTTALAGAADADESALLDRLTRLEAEIESRGAENQFRFGAAAAYYDLVARRIAELREERIQGLQTFAEFIDRRLAPAMNTCLSAANRQELLSRRVARATQLLSTRVDVTQARQTQEVLRSMDRRAGLQLRLQETVEGLSVAAVTYYVVALLGHVAQGARPLGLDLDPELAMALSIPVVLVLVGLGIRRIRRTAAGLRRRPARPDGPRLD